MEQLSLKESNDGGLMSSVGVPALPEGLLGPGTCLCPNRPRSSISISFPDPTVSPRWAFGLVVSPFPLSHHFARLPRTQKCQRGAGIPSDVPKLPPLGIRRTPLQPAVRAGCTQGAAATFCARKPHFGTLADPPAAKPGLSSPSPLPPSLTDFTGTSQSHSAITCC